MARDLGGPVGPEDVKAAMEFQAVQNESRIKSTQVSKPTERQGKMTRKMDGQTLTFIVMTPVLDSERRDHCTLS